jgi:hypothetical protein
VLFKHEKLGHNLIWYINHQTMGDTSAIHGNLMRKLDDARGNKEILLDEDFASQLSTFSRRHCGATISVHQYICFMCLLFAVMCALQKHSRTLARIN